MSWGVKTAYGVQGSFSRKSDAQKLAAQLREANRRAGNSPRFHTAKVVKVGSNPSSGRRLTKLQKKVRAAKKSADRRVAVALAKYLRQENPGRKIVGAKKTKGKAGRITIIPVFAKRGKR